MPMAEVAAVAVPEMTGHLDSYRGTNPMKLHTEYVGAVVLLSLVNIVGVRPGTITPAPSREPGDAS